jgi:hypothetical protein
MAYHLVNLFCRLAGNLAPEREVFYQTVAESNEREGMPRGVLFTPLSIGTYGPERKDAVDSNIRVSNYFLLLVEDIREAPVQSFLHDYRLAARCRVDASLPMRQLAVLVKRTPPGKESGDLAQFRAGLAAEGGARCCEFASAEQLQEILAPLFSEWLATVAVAQAAG